MSRDLLSEIEIKLTLLSGRLSVLEEHFVRTGLVTREQLSKTFIDDILPKLDELKKDFKEYKDENNRSL